jgi:hypothetical protein
MDGRHRKREGHETWRRRMLTPQLPQLLFGPEALWLVLLRPVSKRLFAPALRQRKCSKAPNLYLQRRTHVLRH